MTAGFGLGVEPELVQGSGASIPKPGRSVFAGVLERGAPIRRAIAVLQAASNGRAGSEALRTVLGPRWTNLPEVQGVGATSERVAWALANMWLLARSRNSISPEGSLHDAEAFFVGRHAPALPSLSRFVSDGPASEAISLLSQVVIDDDFRELVPYILEPYAPASRLTVIARPETRVARDAKRKEGVYYTPADVANYMAGAALSALDVTQEGVNHIRVLDPACGTGVFLLGCLRAAAELSAGTPAFNKLRFAVGSLYGFEIAPLAAESCTFVLLHSCLHEVENLGLAPWAAWHALRLNIAVVDALTVSRSQPAIPLESEPLHAGAAEARRHLVNQLMDPTNTEPVLARAQTDRDRGRPANELLVQEPGRIPLAQLFAEAADGFDIVIGNPPYAKLGARPDGPGFVHDYECLAGAKVTGAENTYPLFVEMMWRLTRKGRNASSLVLPLSVAFHQGRQITRCRQALQREGGRVQCAFFDREPHALFGEEVKTRNAILIRRESQNDPPRGQRAAIETGPLRKWTSRSRAQLFNAITFTPLGAYEISHGIPKLDGPQEAAALRALFGAPHRLKSLCQRITTCSLAEASSSSEDRRVFVGSTAYNFLNVSRAVQVRPGGAYPLSENELLCLEFATEEAAWAGYSILSSRVAYWLWRVLGDGFHVNRWFLESLPFDNGCFTSDGRDLLARFGAQLWDAVKLHRIESINAGRLSVAYSPIGCDEERDAVDRLLAQSVGLSDDFVARLRRLIQHVVIVDQNDSRRRAYAPREVAQ